MPDIFDSAHPDAMPLNAPTFANAWSCGDMKGAVVVYETDEEAVRELLAGSPFDYVDPTVWLWVAELRNHTLNPYRESWNYVAISVPGRFEGELGKYNVFAYANDVMAIVAGREMLGEAKKWGDIESTENDGRLSVSLSAYGHHLMSLDLEEDPSGDAGSPAAAFLPSIAEPPQQLNDLLLRSIPSPIPGDKAIKHVIVNPLDYVGASVSARVNKLEFPDVVSTPEWLVTDRLDRLPVREIKYASILSGAFSNGCRDVDGLRVVPVS